MVYNPKRKTDESYSPKPAGIFNPQTSRTWTEYIFTLLVGSIYIYSLNRVIISSTFIQVTQLRLFIMGVAALIFFAVIFYNKYTRIITGAIMALGLLFILFTLERWEYQAAHLYDLRLMVQGYIPYRPDLGVTVLWAISLLLGLAVAIFMLYRFSFYILALTGVTIFLFTWGPGFTRDSSSFLLFLLCFCLLLIRKTNNGLAAVYMAGPICAALVWLVYGSVPMEADLFQRRNLQELFDGPLASIGDFIYTLTNPMYFSFQSTGFSGQGGRLGGAVTPNSRNVMTVQAPGRTYLAGATHNTYTGYRWTSTLEHGDLYTQGMALGRFEMLETAAALIRAATLEDNRDTIPTSLLWGLFPIDDHRHLATRHFATIGLEGYDESNYLHTYLPVDQVTIAIGSNRTGTVFRPLNTRQLWFHAAGPDYLPTLAFDPSGDMRAPGFMARGTQYSMNFLNVNPRLTFIEELLNASTQGIHETREPQPIIDIRVLTSAMLNENITGIITFDDLEVSASDINAVFEGFAHQSPTRELAYMDTHAELLAMLDVFSRDVLSMYAESVREHFMYVPEIVPQRVHDLVAEIIYGLDTDFEKIMAIRDYLIQFPYTLNTQPVLDGVCFVDHFLFVGQEGYCTYYATAMAIMSRIAGVPSRYVEGFLLPPAETEIAVFVVTNMMAHAWVEVYLEGFGWLIVEATAPYAFFNDPGLPPPTGGINPDWHMNEWWEWWEDEFPIDMTTGGLGGNIFTNPDVDVPPPTAGRTINIAQLRNIVLIVLGSTIGLGLLFIFTRYTMIVVRAKKVHKLPINQQIAVYFKGILDISSHCTTTKEATETPFAYGQRMGRRFAFKSDSVLLKDLVNIYYKARFGSNELSDAERSLMEDSYHDMVDYLRRENKRPNFWYLRYIRQIGAIYS
ncbi:MAG: transglutaminase-like domain-containing protein [Defluviitaleaceae bacterium]|nr:transglutaminase-like domain-containing protein [Defluviitaleaceae bacterium]